jgi:hypothetical protein
MPMSPGLLLRMRSRTPSARDRSQSDRDNPRRAKTVPINRDRGESFPSRPANDRPYVMPWRVRLIACNRADLPRATRKPARDYRWRLRRTIPVSAVPHRKTSIVEPSRGTSPLAATTGIAVQGCSSARTGRGWMSSRDAGCGDVPR